MISRRGFLATLAGAIAAGFSRVETAVVDNLAVDWGLQTGDWTHLTFRGVPLVADSFVPPGRIYAIPIHGSYDRVWLVGHPAAIARLRAQVAFQQGDSGEPTPRE